MKRMGIEGKFYLGTAGSEASALMANCRSPSYKVDATRGDTTSRANVPNGGVAAIKTSRVTALGISVEWTMLVDENDVQLATLRAAAVAGTPVAVRVKDKVSGYGLDCDVTLAFEKGEPDEGEQTLKFTGEPTDEAGRLPTFH